MLCVCSINNCTWVKSSLHSRQPSFSSLRPLTSPQPDGLPILLQLSDELVALAHHVLVLLVLVVRPVRLDDAVARDAVDRAGDAAGGNKLGEVTMAVTWASVTAQ